MKVVGTALAILAALLVQSTLGQVAPRLTAFVDPFLLVLVYCGLTGGETHGMLAGGTAGWVQDVHFGGRVVGLSGLSKVVVGFGVGLAGARFLLVNPGSRVLVVFTATLADVLIFERLAALFDVPVSELSFSELLARAVVNSLLGAALFALADRRLKREALR